MQKRFNVDHAERLRLQPGSRRVGSEIRWYWDNFRAVWARPFNLLGSKINHRPGCLKVSHRTCQIWWPRFSFVFLLIVETYTASHRKTASDRRIQRLIQPRLHPIGQWDLPSSRQSARTKKNYIKSGNNRRVFRNRNSRKCVSLQRSPDPIAGWRDD